MKAITVITLLCFLYSNHLWANNGTGQINLSSEKYKLASRSNIPTINRIFLPLVRLLVEKIRKGELNEKKMPNELMDLWRIAATKESLAGTTEEVEISLTPREIKQIRRYIRKNPNSIFKMLLKSILPKESRKKLVNYHPSTIINRIENFGEDIALFDYQTVGDYPTDLAKLEKALTIYAVGAEKAKQGGYGTLVTPAGMPAINIMVDSAIKRKGLGHDAEIIVVEPPYGCTRNLFESWQRRLKVHSISVDEVMDKLPGLINDKTAVIYGESITNPNLMRLDIENILRINRGRAAVLIDDTFATTEMVRSLDYEVDVSGMRYSVDMTMLGLTKGMTGSGNIISGAVTAKREWLDLLSEYRNSIPDEAEVKRALRGLRYLEIRFAAQSRNAKTLIKHISGNSLIPDTVYPGNGHMIYYVFQKLKNAIDNINLLSKFRTLINAVSLGQIRTLFERPIGGTHVTVAEVYRKRGGISPAGIRGSIGIEDIKDLKKEMDAIMEILVLYGDEIPTEDLDDINKIFMAEIVTQEEGKKEIRYLLPKWPIANTDFTKLISDLPDAERERLQSRYDSDGRFKKAVDIIIKATEITDYDPVTIAIHHRLFWGILSGDHTSVISSPNESTTAHRESDEHMEATFKSILLGKEKGLPPIGNFSLYSRLGRPGIVTLELLMAVLEVGIENALNYDYIATSFNSERMAHKAFLEQQAEIVVMNTMMGKYNKTAEELETLRQQKPEEYYKLQIETKKYLEKQCKEIIVVTPPGSALCREAMLLMQNYPIKFKILTPDESIDIESLIESEVSSKTALVYFDYLRFRKYDPKIIRGIVKAKNSKTAYGITDSFNLGYSGERGERDFDFVTHVIYYENNDTGAVVIVKNDKDLLTIWNNLFWTRKNRGTAMSEDNANIAMWYFLPYLRVLDERFDENIKCVEGVLKLTAEVKRIDKRHLEIRFSNNVKMQEFISAIRKSGVVNASKSKAENYFYINEWTSVESVSDSNNSLVLRIGIENTKDLSNVFKNIVKNLDVQKGSKTVQLLRKMRADDGIVTEEELKVAEAKQKIEQQINQYGRLANALGHKIDNVKYVYIEKDAVPINQRYILEGSEWQKRKALLEKMFSGYLFEVYDSNVKAERNKDNSIILASNINHQRYDGVNSRLVLIENAGQDEYFPLDALMLLAVGLLNLDKDDAKGSELKALIANLYQKLTKDSVTNIDSFFGNNYVLSIKLLPITKFDVEFEVFAIDLLGKAA